MKEVIIDTNVILRFFLNDIPEQKIIVEALLQKAKNKTIFITIPQIVIFELDFILEKYYEFHKEEVIDKLKTLVSTDYLRVESKELFIITLTLYSRENLSLVDCFLISQAKERNMEIFTFDKKLKNLILT